MQLPAGELDRLFVRFEHDFGYNSQWLWGGYDAPAKMLFVFTPTDAEPEESFQVRGFRNFLSEEFASPFERGQVIEIINPLGVVDTSSFQTLFFDGF